MNIVISINAIKAKKIKANNTGFIINVKPLCIPASFTEILFLTMSEDVYMNLRQIFNVLTTCCHAGREIMGLILFNHFFQNKLSGV